MKIPITNKFAVGCIIILLISNILGIWKFYKLKSNADELNLLYSQYTTNYKKELHQKSLLIQELNFSRRITGSLINGELLIDSFLNFSNNNIIILRYFHGKCRSCALQVANLLKEKYKGEYVCIIGNDNDKMENKNNFIAFDAPVRFCDSLKFEQNIFIPTSYIININKNGIVTNAYLLNWETMESTLADISNKLTELNKDNL